MSKAGLGTSLKRLSQSGGEWVLEVERLVPFGPNLHQPVQQMIEGASLIGRHLRAVPELVEMVELTERLMNAEEPAEAYELWKGEWLDVEMVRLLSLAKVQMQEAVRTGDAGQGGASRKAVAKLERSQGKLQERLDRIEGGGQLEKMAALIETLTAKVSALEEKLGMDPEEAAALAAKAAAKSGTSSSDSAAPAAAEKSAVSAASEAIAEDGSEASAASEAIAEDGSEASAASEAIAEDGSSAAGEEAIAEDASEAATTDEARPQRPEKRMRPPSPTAMRQSLEMLVGEEIGLKERTTETDFEDGVFFRSQVLDDSDMLVGTMIADIEATVRLACKLLMLPEAEVQDQLADNEASEDSVETMSEIFNTISATINNVKSNPHVRTMPLQVLDPQEFEWVKTTKRRVDLDVEGGGILSICAV